MHRIRFISAQARLSQPDTLCQPKVQAFKWFRSISGDEGIGNVPFPQAVAWPNHERLKGVLPVCVEFRGGVFEPALGLVVERFDEVGGGAIGGFLGDADSCLTKY